MQIHSKSDKTLWGNDDGTQTVQTKGSGAQEKRNDDDDDGSEQDSGHETKEDEDDESGEEAEEENIAKKDISDAEVGCCNYLFI